MNQSVNASSSAYWVIVPAAGVGARMGSALPKQYLPLAGKTVLEHTLEHLLVLPNIKGVLVVLSGQDDFWNDLPIAQHSLVTRVGGGHERSESVLNGLNFLSTRAAPDDWVLVHDAARPCVMKESVINLMDTVATHSVGGILGVPVCDTLKQVEQLAIHQTVDRSLLWQAQTPQLFRYKLLRDCLERALIEGKTITDESSALEAFGYRPLIVQGRSDNIKITRPEDLVLAELLMKQQKTNPS